MKNMQEKKEKLHNEVTMMKKGAKDMVVDKLIKNHSKPYKEIEKNESPKVEKEELKSFKKLKKMESKEKMKDGKKCMDLSKYKDGVKMMKYKSGVDKIKTVPSSISVAGKVIKNPKKTIERTKYDGSIKMDKEEFKKNMSEKKEADSKGLPSKSTYTIQGKTDTTKGMNTEYKERMVKGKTESVKSFKGGKFPEEYDFNDKDNKSKAGAIISRFNPLDDNKLGAVYKNKKGGYGFNQSVTSDRKKITPDTIFTDKYETPVDTITRRNKPILLKEDKIKKKK